MEPVDVNSSTYIDFDLENNDKDPRFKIGDHVEIPKYGKIFVNVHAPNRSEEVFFIKKDKITKP